MDDAYHRLCPLCGGQLTAIAGAPTTPPWGCFVCRQAWHVGELTQEARACFRREQRDWGYPGTKGHERVRKAVQIEREEAHVRGTSLRTDQIGLVPKATLLALSKRRLSSGFSDLIAPPVA